MAKEKEIGPFIDNGVVADRTTRDISHRFDENGREVFLKCLPEPVDDGDEVNASQEVEVQFLNRVPPPAEPFNCPEVLTKIAAASASNVEPFF